MSTTFRKSTTTPLASDVHVSVPLTNFGQNYLLQQNDYVALRACPNLPVSKQFDKYNVWNKGDFFRNRASKRADGTKSKGGGARLSREAYEAEVKAFHTTLSDRQRANEDQGLNLELSKTRFVSNVMIIGREIDFADAFFKTGIWGTNLVGTTDFVKWSATTGDPIKLIKDQKRAVKGKTGYTPNRLLLGREAYDTLQENDLILNRIIGGATTAQPAQVMQQLLANLLEVDMIHVMDGIYNDAIEGEADDMKFIAPDSALLYYAPATLTPEEPTAMACFSWTGYTGATPIGYRMKRFRDDTIESDIFEADMSYDYKVIATELGVFFSDVA